jgi:hypothetical protein
MRIFQAVKIDVAAARDTYKGLGVVASFFTFLQGRATAFAIVFSAVGIYGFLKHYDLTSYAAFVAAIFTGVIGHSIKEDYFQLRHRQLNQNAETKESVTLDLTK